MSARKVTVDITATRDGMLIGETFVAGESVRAMAKTEMILELRMKQTLHIDHNIVKPKITLVRRKG